jgi:hypothetical protein
MHRNKLFIVPTLAGLLLAAATATIIISEPMNVFAERVPFAIQNVTQSSPAELVDGLFQIGVLLPQRDDGKFYHGVVTYSSSHAVEVNVLQPPIENASTVQPITVPGLNASISALDFQEPSNFNTVPFAGSEVILIHRSSQPFTAAYSIVGELVDPEPLPSPPSTQP